MSKSKLTSKTSIMSKFTSETSLFQNTFAVQTEPKKPSSTHSILSALALFSDSGRITMASDFSNVSVIASQAVCNVDNSKSSVFLRVRPMLHNGLFCTTTDPMHFSIAHCFAILHDVNRS